MAARGLHASKPGYAADGPVGEKRAWQQIHQGRQSISTEKACWNHAGRANAIGQNYAWTGVVRSAVNEPNAHRWGGADRKGSWVVGNLAHRDVQAIDNALGL